MKKALFVGLVIVLLAFTAIPVLAAGPNGHGHGNSAGGDRDQTRQQDQEHSNNGRGKNKQLTTGTQVSVGRKPFYLQGTIVSISGTDLTILVNHGNARVKQFIGLDLVVSAAGTQRIFEIAQGVKDQEKTEGATTAAPSTSATDDEGTPGKKSITLGELAANDIVAIHGIVVGGVYKATMITVYDQGIGGLPDTDLP